MEHDEDEQQHLASLSWNFLAVVTCHDMSTSAPKKKNRYSAKSSTDSLGQRITEIVWKQHVKASNPYFKWKFYVNFYGCSLIS